MTRYSIEITDEAEQDLNYYRAYERKTIIDNIYTHLAVEPATETNNRRLLRPNPLATWELRLGKYRVFYEIEIDPAVTEDTELALVIIVSIGHKEHNMLYIRGKVVTL